MEQIKLRYKVGEHEFEAEGSETAVAAHLERWRSDIQKLDTKSPTPPPPRHPRTPVLIPSTPNAISTDGIQNNDLAGVAGVDDKGLIVLRAIPTGTRQAADAALLVLYAALKIRGEDEVPATKLSLALARSGVRVNRIDRDIKPYVRDRLITRYGKGKGGRYRLTTTGIAKAVEITSELLKQFA